MRLKILCLCMPLLLVCVAKAQSVPRSSHVWMITEENHSYENIIGNRDMPYYNQLAQQYGLATQFYSNQHSSLPALMWFVAGGPVEPNNGTRSCHHNDDNIVRELLKHGYSWRSYQENLPYAGFQGLFSPNGRYYRRHNPLIDFSDVCPGSGQNQNSVPYSQMSADFADGNTANYVYITPDTDEDAHNGSLAAADQWLQDHVPAILARPEFGSGGDGILFIVWDEGNLRTDNRCSADVKRGCGGHTATLVIGPHVKQGFRSNVTYHNENVLKTTCVAMGLSSCPGAAQDAAPMADFFTTGSPSPSHRIIISNPSNGDVIQGAVRLHATASESKHVSQTQVWDNGVKVGTYGEEIDAILHLSPGQHSTTVFDLDASGNIMHRATVNYKVEKQGEGVQIMSPSPGEVFNLTVVHVVAHARESQPVSQVQVWDNGVKLGWYRGADIDRHYSLSPGSHVISVMDLDSNFNLIHETQVSYSVY